MANDAVPFLVWRAGFAFGVTCSLLFIAVVLATVGGVALYLLAFTANRLLTPIPTEVSDDE